MAMIRHSPYHHRHVAAGAEMVDRLGFAAPLRFNSVEAEHRATREAAGLFDVYYQVPVEIAGRGALDFAQWACVNDVARLSVGQGLYTSLCNDRGGIIDDLTCFRVGERRYWLMPTPARVAAVVSWLDKAAAERNAVVTNLGNGVAYMSVQGPRSRQIVQALTQADLGAQSLGYYHFTRGELAQVPDVMISRTGYSGELGFELFYPSEYAEHVYDAVMAAGKPLGLVPCGLGALRTLRMEKKYPLYGLDLTEDTTPIEAGIGWTVRFGKGAFSGRATLERQHQEGPKRKLVVLRFKDLAADVAIGDPVSVNKSEVGRVTSTEKGHTVGATLAMTYLPSPCAVDGAAVTVRSKAGTSAEAQVMSRAPYDPERKRLLA